MKPDIHPPYYPNAKVSCACGTSFTTGSTLPEIHVEICSHCHPFFTGEMKLIDTQGRIERFQAKQRRAQATREKKTKTPREVSEQPRTLREMLTSELANLKKQAAAPKANPSS